jgi:hypothetical protein
MYSNREIDMRAPIPVAYVTSAPSNWYKLTFDGSGYNKEPILAFAITAEGYSTPIVPFQTGILDDDYTLLYPDGRVDDSFRIYDNVDEWFATMVISREAEIHSIATNMVKHSNE